MCNRPFVHIHAGRVRCRRAIGDGGDTDAHDDHVGRHQLTVGQAHARDAVAVALDGLTPTPQRTSTPLRECTLAAARPISVPSPRMSGAGAPSSTVTGQPFCRAVAATSRPMKPAPMTMTRAVPSAMRSRSASESASVRSSTTPSRRG